MQQLSSAQRAEIGETHTIYRLATFGHEAYRTTTGFATVDIAVVSPSRFDVQVKTATTPSWLVVNKSDPSTIHRRADLYFVLVQYDVTTRAVVRDILLRSEDVYEMAARQYNDWRNRKPDGIARGLYIKERPVPGTIEDFASRAVPWESLSH